MKNRILSVAGAAVVLAGAVAPAEAQGTTCTAGVAQQACQTAGDMLNYMTPQLATAIAAGSSTLGQSGVLGGLGHVAFSIRGTGVINGGVPDVASAGFSTTNTPQNYAVKNQVVPGVGFDASIGIWKGFPLATTHIGGVDAIVSALYLPNVTGNEVSIKAKGGNLKLGYGVRIGLLDEGLATPGVYFSYLKRDLPTVSLGVTASGGSGADGSIALNDFAVKTTAYRLVAAKSLLFLSLQAGIGQDKYESNAALAATITSPVSGTSSGTASMSMTRTNLFVGATFNLLVLKFVVEAGQVSGGTFPTSFNTFSKSANASRTYLSGGLRFGL